MPEVSFIIPAYNAALYLGSAIDSIRKQTAGDWEALIIDDGSTDSTPDIARRYADADARIRVIRRDSPSGSAFTPRLEGIKAARGTLIAPLDADDTIPEDYLERLLELRERSKAEVVYPLMYAGTDASAKPVVEPDANYFEKVMKGKESVKFTLKEWRVTCNGGLIPRYLYLKAFSRYGEDHNDVHSDETLTRWILLLANSVIFTDVPYFYREVATSLTHTVSPRRIDLLKSDIEVFDIVKNNYPPDSEEYLLAQIQIFNHILDFSPLLADHRSDKKFLSEAYALIEKARGLLNLDLLKGKVSRHLWQAHHLPTGQLARFSVIRNKARSVTANALAVAKLPLRRVKRIYQDWAYPRAQKRAFQSNLEYLKKGILPPGSESEAVYDRYYASGSDESSRVRGDISMIVCPFDGRVCHGGTTDRIRGILSTYAEAKRRGIPFRICWTTPFRLEDYLVPATFDWRISPEEMTFEKGVSIPVVIQDEPDEESDIILRSALDSLSGELHIYSNSDSEKGNYKALYEELFKPSETLSDAIDWHKKQLGEEYYSFTFRFAKLLGDFYDFPGEVLSPEERIRLMTEVADKFAEIASELPAGSRLHVASDSKTFLDFMANRDKRIHIVEGDVKNVDRDGIAASDGTWLKMFVDQHLIMGATRVYRLTGPGMYPSGFPRFAAEVGGREFISVDFN